MKMRLAYVTVTVKDQNAALRFYTQKLGFEKRSDDRSVPGMRWLTVAPKGQEGVEIVLQKPDPRMMGAKMAKDLLTRVGKNPTWVLETDDCKGEYEALKRKGIKFMGPPTNELWGVSCVFFDLYGNPYNLVERPKR